MMLRKARLSSDDESPGMREWPQITQTQSTRATTQRRRSPDAREPVMSLRWLATALLLVRLRDVRYTIGLGAHARRLW